VVTEIPLKTRKKEGGWTRGKTRAALPISMKVYIFWEWVENKERGTPPRVSYNLSSSVWAFEEKDLGEGKVRWERGYDTSMGEDPGGGTS